MCVCVCVYVYIFVISVQLLYLILELRICCPVINTYCVTILRIAAAEIYLNWLENYYTGNTQLCYYSLCLISE
jgi:hypothetical protein